VDAFMCYKQKGKVVSLNLAHPVHETGICAQQSLDKHLNWTDDKNAVV